VVTDLGCITQHVVEKLSGLHALVIECNHDLDMLMGGPYPVSLKQRVSGRFGTSTTSGARRLVEALDRGPHAPSHRRAPLEAEQPARARGGGASRAAPTASATGSAWRPRKTASPGARAEKKAGS
jgi:hypothetical protein